MSVWPGKYVIGLTGNIATGKSVVRKMLEHLGAYGIDADALGHRAIARDAPGYAPVIEAFGRWILGPDGQVQRERLGRVVFADPSALGRLEAIVHPLVRQAIDVLVRRSPQKVIVIEAIKLLEGPLKSACDTIIVTHANMETQMRRLVQKRGMTEQAARQRIASQSLQSEKVKVANFVVSNDGTFEDTWRQVQEIWNQLFPSPEAPAVIRPAPKKGELEVEKARPRQADEIAALITQLSGGKKKPTHDDIMEAFGEKAFLLIHADGKNVGLAGYQVENLVARTDEVYLDGRQPLSTAMKKIMEAIESTSRDLQCEVSLLFLPPHLARYKEVWQGLGYEIRDIRSLGVRAWEEAAHESMPSGTVLLFKQLRQDRVLRPV
jgi:dephospho-CoA kinase